jgi:hypothetical protein
LGRPTEVDVFTERESLDFLTERTKLGDPGGGMTLAREVGHLPLALAQAAAVIKAQRLTYLFETSLAGFGRVLGAEHPSRARVRGNLAQARRQREGPS